VGRQIMAAAAPFLTPLTLELGGKSPTFVHHDADISVAARKIALGKFNNAGQTCVAPDYVLVHKSVAGNLVSQLKETITEFYGQDPSTSPNYGRIINHRHFDRIANLLEGATVAIGGQRDRETRYIAPTLLYPATWTDKAMEDEIFGPLLPILEYEDLDQAISWVQDRPKPLALYVFSKDARVSRRVTESISFGGGCVNSTLLHVASHKLPFGGVGPSGQGSYHGKASFECFSHEKSVLTQPTSIDLGLAYPNKNLGIEMVRRVFR